MPEFTTGETILKAARPSPGRGINPSGRMMRAMERDAEARIARALDAMRRDLLRGLNAQNVQALPGKLQSREILQPFTDTIIAVLRDIALAGSSFGQEQIERFVFGTRKQVEGIDIEWELANAGAEEWARIYGFDLVGGITRTTQRRLQKTKKIVPTRKTRKVKNAITTAASRFIVRLLWHHCPGFRPRP